MVGVQAVAPPYKDVAAGFKLFLSYHERKHLVDDLIRHSLPGAGRDILYGDLGEGGRALFRGAQQREGTEQKREEMVHDGG
ncbi:hypothetical protein EUGRSUZ_H04295 [Eucalyptus grandis]|uniref:Uncharacterized protein n=2 Tax=Eucalyptus grandis TaxID=71139 RepID=A0A059B615_EUCGR|nr:hypothetical protein EUGRSUZ_H04295 [Eucalyptus grandis]